ncbi:hypothetical protein HY249_02395 [Candidatus Azambacteria bacterium]|nr:hypothetical protein [Candidatus Azambacteria bacterium]
MSIEGYNIQKAFLVNTKIMTSRVGIPAEVIGLKFASINGCRQYSYHVRYPDGEEYLISPLDMYYYAMIPEEDVKNGKLPELKP